MTSRSKIPTVISTNADMMRAILARYCTSVLESRALSTVAGTCRADTKFGVVVSLSFSLDDGDAEDDKVEGDTDNGRNLAKKKVSDFLCSLCMRFCEGNAPSQGVPPAALKLAALRSINHNRIASVTEYRKEVSLMMSQMR
jgi:hypothetical protein